jgi:hypothetical protein
MIRKGKENVKLWRATVDGNEQIATEAMKEARAAWTKELEDFMEKQKNILMIFRRKSYVRFN